MPRTRLLLALAASLLVVLALTVGPAANTPLLWFDVLAGELAEAAGRRPPTLNESEALANVLLFVPLGAAGALVLRRHTGWVVVGLGALSLAIEVLQSTLPGRTPSYRDVVLNSAGALVGVVAVLVLRGLRRVGSRR